MKTKVLFYFTLFINLTLFAQTSFQTNIPFGESYSKSTGIAIGGNQLYIADLYGNIYKLDLTNDGAVPILYFSGQEEGVSIREIWFDNNYLYMAINNGNDYLTKIIKRINTNLITPVAEDLTTILTSFYQPVLGITSDNSNLYVNIFNTIYKVNLNATDHTAVTYISDLNNTSEGTINLTIRNNYLYVVDNGNLVKYNLNATNPIKEPVLNFPNSYLQTVVNGELDNEIYIVDSFEIKKVNLTTLTISPALYNFGAAILYGMSYFNNTFYFSRSENYISKVNTVTLNSQQFIKKRGNFYPNPTNDVVNFNQNIKSVLVFSIDGKLINTNLENNKVDVSNLSKGLYLIQMVTDEGEVISDKLIKN